MVIATTVVFYYKFTTSIYHSSDIEDDVKSFADFTTEIVVEGVARCINLSLPALKLNHRLPGHIPARYKLCMDISNACKVVSIIVFLILFFYYFFLFAGNGI